MGCQCDFCVNKILRHLQQEKGFQMTLKSSVKLILTIEQTEHLHSELNVGINRCEELLGKRNAIC